eukprot:12925236-Prorocentrum_lima.AAC.1
MKNKHGEDVTSLWQLYAHLMTQAIINALAAEIPESINTRLSDPCVAYSDIILNFETDKLMDTCSRTAR